MDKNLLPAMFNSGDIDAGESKSITVEMEKEDGGRNIVKCYQLPGNVKTFYGIEIPAYHSREERREIIYGLYNNDYKVSEIAYWTGVSKTTAYNDINRIKNMIDYNQRNG